MPELVTALILSLAWFAALNAVASLLALVLTRTIAIGRLARTPGALVGLRLMPAAISLVFVLGIFLPAHWRFEPRGIDETFGIGVYALAAAGALLAMRSAMRMVSVARAGWKLRVCSALPRIAAAEAGPIDVYEVQGLAGVSLAGVVWPRILVGPAVRLALTPAELDAAVAHELAHRAAGDNVTRFLMFCAPDLFGQSAAARAVEDRWRADAECQADARAVGGDASRAIDLASALVKVARLAAGPPANLSSPAWSTLHEAPELETRVRRLLAGSALSPAPPRRTRVAVALALVVATVGAAAAVAADVHEVTEGIAHLLP